jgi:hypothetical protein
LIKKGGPEMETVIVIGMVWALASVVCLLVNYRFHRSYAANNDQEFILESPVAIENNDEWGGELKVSMN